MEGLGSISASDKIYLSSQSPDRLWGPHNLLYSVYRGLFSRGVKRQGREADHSPQISVEVKKTWVFPRTSSWRSA
jgi:hypothetical protein